MKFKFLVKNSMKIALIVFSLLIVGSAGFTIYRVVTYRPDAFSIVSLVFSVIVLVLSGLVLLNTNYTFTEDKLKINLGIMCQQIKYTDILCIKNYVNQKEMFIIFRPLNPKQEGDLSQIMINIKPELYTDFVEALKSKNDMITYDEIDSTLKEEDNE